MAKAKKKHEPAVRPEIQLQHAVEIAGNTNEWHDNGDGTGHFLPYVTMGHVVLQPGFAIVHKADVQKLLAERDDLLRRLREQEQANTELEDEIFALRSGEGDLFDEASKG